MNIIKRHRSLLVCISVIASLLSSCCPVICEPVTIVRFKNCTNDTLIIGKSDYDNIDSIWFDYIHVDRLSKAPLLTSIDSILLDISKKDLESCKFYDEEYKAITPTGLSEENKKKMIAYPDSFLLVKDISLFNNTDTKYFFLIKLEDAKNHSWDEIRAKKLYKKWFTVRNKDGEFDTNIKYSE